LYVPVEVFLEAGEDSEASGTHRALVSLVLHVIVNLHVALQCRGLNECRSAHLYTMRMITMITMIMVTMIQ
jgi:hypothetical protein